MDVKRDCGCFSFVRPPEGALEDTVPDWTWELSDKASIPGSTLPSRSSKEAPPPVETCDTLSSVLKKAGEQAVAVSPPPMIEQQPLAVAATTASMTAFVLWLEFVRIVE